MRLVTCRVMRNERETIEVNVPAWEVDLLRAVHGPEAVEIMGDTEDQRGYPDAGAEYDRLEKRYGVDREEGGAPFVAQVYGGTAGQRLAGLIEIERTKTGGSKTLKLPK